MSVTELVVRLPWGTDVPDVIVEGIGLADKIEIKDEGMVITDGLNGRQVFIRT